MICFCTAGTLDVSISTPRSPRATITASASAMIASRLATACGFSILATIRARLFRLSSSSRSRVMSSACRTNESPTYATECVVGPLEIEKVLLGERRHGERGARDVDSLVRPDASRQLDLQPGPAGAALDHIHRHGAVGEENALADLQVVGQRLVGAGQLMRIVAALAVAGKAELGAEVALDGIAGNRSQADLGPAEVLQDRELTPHLVADLADRLERRGVLVVRAVREVEPEDVNARLDHLPDDGRIPRGGPERRHDLGPHLAQRLENGSRHGVPSRKASFPTSPGSLHWAAGWLGRVLPQWRRIIPSQHEACPPLTSEKNRSVNSFSFLCTDQASSTERAPSLHVTVITTRRPIAHPRLHDLWLSQRDPHLVALDLEGRLQRGISRASPSRSSAAPSRQGEAGQPQGVLRPR